MQHDTIRYDTIRYDTIRYDVGTLLPVVLDADLVDMEMGTGVVKVTPAHDPVG